MNTHVVYRASITTINYIQVINQSHLNNITKTEDVNNNLVKFNII